MLDFLWTWKVATTPMLGEVGYKGKSIWWTYKALKKLQAENYIQLLPRGRNVEQELWALTDYGFEIILMDRDDIVHYRYKPHAPAHDYLSTCLQLGDLWQFSCDKLFFTEQMLASLAKTNFPENFKNDEGHIPDGISFLRSGIKEAVIGYEVDLILKATDRYHGTFEYWSKVEPAMIIWLVRNSWMAQRIFEMCNSPFYQTQEGEPLRSRIFLLVWMILKKISGAPRS